MESTHIKIYGRGTIDANARVVEKTANLLVMTIVPMNTSYFICDGITVKESNIWSVCPAWSDHLTFTNMKFMNQLSNTHENDCIDINGCQEVLVKHCIGIALDDPFSTKVWMENEGIGASWNGPAEHLENVVFDDCLSWTWCYGFKVGQGSYYEQNNVTFKNGTVYECAAALGIHHKYGTGTFRNITFDNIDIEKVCCQNDDNRCWLMIEVMDKRGCGPVYDVTVKNITVRDKGTTRSKILGFNEESMIKGVTFENIKLLGNERTASTLAQMNVTNRNYYDDVKVLGGNPAVIEAVYYNNASGTTRKQNVERASLHPLGTEATDIETYITGANGAWASYEEVDFGKGNKSITVSYIPIFIDNSYIDFYIDSMDYPDNVIGSICFTEDSNEYTTRTLDVSNITGVHTMYMVFRSQNEIKTNIAYISRLEIR